jgi:hypothetical protein
VRSESACHRMCAPGTGRCLTRISTPVDRRNALGEFEVEAASVPPGAGGVGGEVSLAENG